MFRGVLTALVVVVPVALVSGLIVYARIEQIAEPAKIREQGLETVRQEDATGFAFLAFVFGALASFAYLWMQARWPAAAANVFLALGLGLALILSIVAAIARPAAGLGGVPEVIALNLLWGAGYGWLMPLALRLLGAGAGS